MYVVGCTIKSCKQSLTVSQRVFLLHVSMTSVFIMIRLNGTGFVFSHREMPCRGPARGPRVVLGVTHVAWILRSLVPKTKSLVKVATYIKVSAPGERKRSVRFGSVTGKRCTC